MLRLQIGKKEIGEGRPCLIVAEIGVNHDGMIDKASKMIRVAAAAGVDAVKLQRRDIDAILTQEAQAAPYVNERSYGSTYGAHRRALELPDAAWPVLKDLADSLGLMFFATPYDPGSADFLLKLGVPCVKVASCDVTNHPLLDSVATMGVPVLMSTGMSTEEEIDLAVRRVWGHMDPKQLVLMHCCSSYPSDAKELNLPYMRKLAKKYDGLVGYSGHERGLQTTLAAVALGAAVVERHFTLDRTSKGPDHAASLEPEGLTRLCRDIRRIEEAMTARPKKVLLSEKPTRERLAKSLVAARALHEGEIMERSLIAIKGPGTGMSPLEMENLLGKRVKTYIPYEALLTPEMFE